MKQVKLILSDEAHKTINDLVVAAFLTSNHGGLSQAWKKVLDALRDGKMEVEITTKAERKRNHCGHEPQPTYDH